MANPLHDAVLAPHAGSAAPFILRPGEGGVDYGAFLRRVAQVRGALRACGLSAGDRLLLQVEKSVAALEIYAACLGAGVIFVPLNTAYTEDEIRYFLDDAEPRLFICAPARRDALAPLAEARGIALLTLGADGTGSFAGRACGQPDAAAPVPRGTDDIAALLYTSGTTGRSKGAMLTHGNLLSNAGALRDLWAITDRDRLLHALPIFHAHGLFVAVNTTLLAGASMIFLPGFAVQTVLRALPDATTMMGVPTFYTRLLDAPDFTRDRAGHMRLFVSGSAPLLADTHERFEARTGQRILERYGMTETGMNTSNPYDGERRPGSVGFPLPGVDLKITDAQGATVAAGEIGTIELRGPNVFRGYWRKPEKTAEELRADGWFVTGDLGRIDSDGYVHIVGRGKDLIISGGYNVYPREVERVLDRADWVRESAVIGVPHPDFGEGVVAVIAPEDGVRRDLDGLRNLAAERLADYKRPKKIVLVDELPRNAMGKVQKNALREAHAGLFDPDCAGS